LIAVFVGIKLRKNKDLKDAKLAETQSTN